MIFYYVNDSDRSADVAVDSLRIQNQIQQRTDTCRFLIVSNAKPTENHDIRIFDGALISSHSSVTVVLKDTYQTDVGAFRAGQTLYIGIGTANEEKVTVASYVESTRTLTLTAAPATTFSEDDQIGELIFGGTVARVSDKNVRTLQQIEYEVIGTDYTKIFDKKIISDTWEDMDARKIVNDILNTTVNFNAEVDDMEYDNDAAVQAEWIESGDGDNPTRNATNHIQGSSAVDLNWTYSGGSATFAGTPTSMDISVLTGASSGSPTKGNLTFWNKPSIAAGITDLRFRIGSDASNYLELTFTPEADTEIRFKSLKLVDGTVTGTPDWTAMAYAAIVVNETVSGSIMIDDLRVTADGSFTMYNFKPSVDFDDLRSPQLKPTSLLNQMAKKFERVWYIDYERDIHFADYEQDDAPFSIEDDTDNFVDLTTEVDVSSLGNRITVNGGEKTSTSTYSQVFEGDNAIREWILKSKFNSLTIAIDDNSSTDTAEAGTTTTNVTATAHGLVTGDYIVNRTRSNAVRQITKVDDDNFTVEAVTGQTSGDTFSKFDTSKTAGIEGLDDETSFDYVYNSNEKSVRATASEATLDAGDFILFTYKERVPIQLRYTDSASVGAMKALGFGDGIFDLDPITDRNIQDTATALLLAEAKVREFSTAIITGSFRTDRKGLRAGQILHVKDSVNRSLEDDFVIQTISKRQSGGQFNDYCIFDVRFGTTIYGWIEFMQKILRTTDAIELNVDDVVETYITADEEIEYADTNQVVVGGGFNPVSGTETITYDDSSNVVEVNSAYKWHTSPTPPSPQELATRWGHFHWKT